jgi:hypothetical protein
MPEKVRMSQEMCDMILQDSGLGHFELSDRDSACGILPDLDYEAQLIAISALLRRNDQADAETERQIKEVDDYARRTSGWRNQRAVDEWVDLLHGSTYQGAAHSMAALGMLAPFYESMFFQAFQGIRQEYFGMDVVPIGHTRSGITKADEFWDCHLFYNAKIGKKERKLVSGIEQLADAAGLKAHLPPALHNMLEALFSYRNKMFHGGFEWPLKECANFTKRIEDEGWQDWFSLASHGDDPFIVYLTETFINHCLSLVHELLNAFGAYCKAHVSVRDVIEIEIIPPAE